MTIAPFTQVVGLSLCGTRVGSWYWLRLGRPTLQGKFITVTVRRDVTLSLLERRRIKSEKTTLHRSIDGHNPYNMFILRI